MNTETKPYPKTKEQIHVGGLVPEQTRSRPPAIFSLVPKDLAEAMQLAKLIAESDLAPKDYRGKPGNVLISVQMGQEIGLSPMAAIQSIAVINGKPSLYGDVGKAILLSNGFIIEEAGAEEIKEKGFATCKITRPGHPPCIRTFGIDDAKKAKLWGKEGTWTTYPERQMAWRAFWFAARDIGADVLQGLSGLEEVSDLEPKDITPAKTEYQTGTERLRNAVVKEQPVDVEVEPKLLDKVLKAIKEAITPADMNAAAELAKGLPEEDRDAAALAYAARLKELKKSKGNAPELTYAQIAEKLNKATDQDNLDASADLIQYCGGGADQIEELNKLYKKRRDEFKEGGAK